MNQWTSFGIVLVIVLFAMYRRIRRSIGVQPIRTRRLKVRMGFLIFAGVMVLLAGFLHPASYIGDALGLIAGGILAYYAIRHCRIAEGPQGWTYQTNKWIDMTVVALFLARVLYRLYFSFTMTESLQHAAPGAQPTPQQMNSFDPLTSGVLFLMVTYYAAYYLYILSAYRTKIAEAGA